MNNLLKQITPNTKGVIWISPDIHDVDSFYFKTMDYLLNGLYSSTRISNPEASDLTLVGESFGKPIYIYAAKEFKNDSLKNFFSLFDQSLTDDQKIIWISENQTLEGIYDKLSKDFTSKITLFKL